MKQKVINFFAGPGAGKSTMGAGLFAELKLRGHTPEFAYEWIKQAEYEGRNRHDSLLPKSQDYITAKQHYRLRTLEGKVELIITDSPIILGLVYSDPDYLPSMEQVMLEAYDRYDNLNFFVKRTKEYIQVGRGQSKDEAIEKDEELKYMLRKYGIHYVEVPYHPITFMELIPALMNGIGWKVSPNPYGKFLSPPSGTTADPFGPATTEFGMPEFEKSLAVLQSSRQRKDSGVMHHPV